MRPVAYQTLIGLLAATGMRISEALALNDEHVDPSSTYWYLIASPELAGVIASRLDNIDLDVNP